MTQPKDEDNSTDPVARARRMILKATLLRALEAQQRPPAVAVLAPGAFHARLSDRAEGPADVFLHGVFDLEALTLALDKVVVNAIIPDATSAMLLTGLDDVADRLGTLIAALPATMKQRVLGAGAGRAGGRTQTGDALKTSGRIGDYRGPPGGAFEPEV